MMLQIVEDNQQALLQLSQQDMGQALHQPGCPAVDMLQSVNTLIKMWALL